MKKDINMCEGPLLWNIIRYTFPIIITNVLQLLFNAADLVVVGRFGGGSRSVAAVGATGALINVVVTLFIGLSVGASVTVAQMSGAGKKQAVSDTVHTVFPVAIICGAFLTVVGTVFARPLLIGMGTPDTVLAPAVSYVRIYFCGMIGSLTYNYGAAVLRAVGDTRSPLIFLTVAGILNVGLNLIFVLVFRMDVAGVALATILSQYISAILVVIALMRRQDACHLDLRKMRIHLPALLDVLRIGLPSGIQSVIFSASNVLIQSSVNSFGEIVMSGSAAAANIESFVWTAMNAFQQTAMNFSGQNIGRMRYDRVRRVCRLCLVSVIVTGVVCGGGVYLFGRPLLSIYIPGATEAIEAGMVRLAYIGLLYALDGIMDTLSGQIRGMGHSVSPMLATILGICGLRIVWILTVFRSLDSLTIGSFTLDKLPLLFISYPISWILTFTVEFIIYFRLIHKQKKLTPDAFVDPEKLATVR